jgi:type IV pili sensor histidine kinase/response regulator
MRPFNRLHRRLAVSGLLVCILAPGCATTVAPPRPLPPEEANSASTTHSLTSVTPVTRQGRYTLLELTPEPAQRDLMRQIIDVSIPSRLNTSVGDAMRHVLLHSGYRLCDTPEAAELYAFPLPASHLRLGPMILRNTLLTLTSPAWVLSVDDASRQVCFKRQAVRLPELPADDPGADAAEAAQTREVQP